MQNISKKNMHAFKPNNLARVLFASLVLMINESCLSQVKPHYLINLCYITCYEFFCENGSLGFTLI